MKRLRTPDYALGLFGFVLFSSLFAPWYKVTDGTYDAWRSLKFIDILLFLIALLAMATVAVTAAKDSPELPVALDVLTTWAGMVAVLLVLYRILSVVFIAPGTERSWGLIVAAIGAVGTLAGAWWATRTEDAPGLRPPRSRRRALNPRGSSRC